ncbi:rep protein [Circoviridae sp.]|nr:rep protein [Circoviridae sp.]
MSDTEKVEHNDEVGNTKTTSRNRGWCFTLNNYTQSELDFITQYFIENCVKHIIGIEKGKKNETPHLQGWCYFKNGVSFKRVKFISERAHWEVAKGNAEQNRVYCSKESIHSMEGINKLSFRDQLKQKIIDKRYKHIVWREWQQKVIDIAESEPDDRKFYWVWERTGNVGKSFLAKYLALTQDCILADGKKDNIFNQINIMLDQEKEFKTVLLDIPRKGEEYVNYRVLEQIKNGFIYSGKYEGGQCFYDYVNIICFANFEPEYSAISEDRWVVINLNQNNLDHLEL